MPDTLVIAPPGRICPKEGGKHKGVITDALPVPVPDTAYYRRLIQEGSLLVLPAKALATAGAPAFAEASAGKPANATNPAFAEASAGKPKKGAE